MGVQVTLKDIQSGFLTAVTHTANNTLNEAGFDRALDRTANVNNAMAVNLDMGANKTINQAAGVAGTDGVNFQQLSEIVNGFGTLATDTSIISHLDSGSNVNLDDYLQNQEMTLAEAVASTTLHEGAVVSISDRAHGVYDVVLASGVTIDGYLFVQCTGVASLALSYRIGDVINVTEVGANENFSAATQAAFNFSNGLVPVTCDAGTYIADTQIDMFTSTDETTIYQEANSFVGAGKEATIIINRTGTNWIIHKPSVTAASNSVRMVGFKLNDMTVKIDGSSPAGSEGPLIYSAWQGECRRYFTTAMKGNGFDIPLDNALNTNVDRYSCGYFTFEDVTILSSEGIGINLGNGSTTMGLYNFYILGNKLGGVFMSGNSNYVNLGSIADNGATLGTAGFGIHSAWTAELGAPHNNEIMNVEIDNNWGRDVILDGYNNRLECRIVQNGTLGVGGNTFRATDMLLINSSTSFGARNNEVKCLFRADNSGTAALNCITTTDTSGTQDNHIEGTFAISGGGSNVVKANLLGTSRPRNVVTEEGTVIASSMQTAIYDSNKVFLINGASVALSTTLQQLTFTSDGDASGLWNNSLNEYTVPHTGKLTIEYCGPFRAIIANDAFNIYPKINGNTQNPIEFAQGLSNLAGNEFINFTVTFDVDKDDVVQLWGDSATNSGNFFIGGSLTTTRFIME